MAPIQGDSRQDCRAAAMTVNAHIMSEDMQETGFSSFSCCA